MEYAIELKEFLKVAASVLGDAPVQMLYVLCGFAILKLITFGITAYGCIMLPKLIIEKVYSLHTKPEEHVVNVNDIHVFNGHLHEYHQLMNGLSDAMNEKNGTDFKYMQSKDYAYILDKVRSK